MIRIDFQLGALSAGLRWATQQETNIVKSIDLLDTNLTQCMNENNASCQMNRHLLEREKRRTHTRLTEENISGYEYEIQKASERLTEARHLKLALHDLKKVIYGLYGRNNYDLNDCQNVSGEIHYYRDAYTHLCPENPQTAIWDRLEDEFSNVPRQFNLGPLTLTTRDSSARHFAL